MNDPFGLNPRPRTRQERRAHEATLRKCRCGNTLGLGSETDECPSCARKHAPFDDAKAAVADNGVFSEDQVYALHRMIDALRALQ
jgi:hypothetical protein